MNAIDSPYLIFRLRARRDELRAEFSVGNHEKQTLPGPQAELQRVEAAIARIENLTYGSCCRCHGPIDRERLQADPLVLLCQPCSRETDCISQRGACGRHDQS